MKLNPYLHFNGTCEAAFKFYEQSLGGKILVMMTHEGSPVAAQTPTEWLGKIIHARIAIGDTILMGSDSPPGHQEDAKGFSLTFGVDTPAEAERAFQALAEKGTVRMPMAETFFAHRFGMVADQFGMPWMVICEKMP
jgi:PhnB protein